MSWDPFAWFRDGAEAPEPDPDYLHDLAKEKELFDDVSDR